MIVDPEKAAEVIAEIAETEIAARFGKLEAGDIDTKSGPNDFVTEADRAAEAALAKALPAFYPGAAFIGEESAAADPSILDALSGDGAFWIVDPLDGTRNFVQKRCEFGAIVALIVNGEIRNGWIYAIPDKKFAMSSKGDGASWAGARAAPLKEAGSVLKGLRAIGNLAEPWKSLFVPGLRATFETEQVHCSAYGYIKMLRGEKDFGLYSRCHPWDHAAGVLMLREIGGRAEYLDDGAPYAPLPTQGRPMLVSGADDRWRRVRDALAA